MKKRTHNCGELRKEAAGNQVVLAGWIDSVRDHGGVLFVDLRDREGLTQVVVHPGNQTIDEALAHFKTESVLEVEGEVVLREPETINPRMKTGEIEVSATSVELLNRSKTPPFPMDDEKADKVNEDLRLRFRYMDLRRPRNLEVLRLRHRATQAVRQYLDEVGFLEIETPSLFKSTPEGAREFLVPSRLNPNEYYALVQSPQQYKQMLMVAGVEKYFQIARCFRDEDLRADRQPEFTQIDLEMSFIDREDMYALVEGLMKRVWKDAVGVDVPTPFPRLSYDEVMNRFGSDKPDTRFDMEITDFSDTFAESGFKVFAGTIANGGVVKAINAKGLADLTQGELKGLEEAARSLGAKGLAFIKAEKGEWKSPILKFLSEEEQQALRERLNVEDGDVVFFAAGEWESACTILGRVRLDSAKLLEKRGKITRDPADYRFLWVIEFPLMLFDEEAGRYTAAHHPFTSPVPEDLELLDSDPKAVRGQHYDLVLNGVELGGGSIRIHQPDLQKKVFEDVLGLPKDVVQERFGYMLEAFSYGAPPHGGIAFGLDRLTAILANRPSIRDVIAFPKTQKGQDLMASSPSPVSEKQLRDLFIRNVEPVRDDENS
ncbi:aspartate--tRNA ligase [Puniceicoccus vermicola]|uniref:Aspartate--tRNA(Asp/Asn) ligase n=1 Tax=Puniceicoccus vermicola TaxID=388746 RepID=A0A7X1E2T8_9BACT|nr:aspartate--tRNA ligase [Puniceicoccus vermicola]MBC2600274.1 aspartate--tRNA ligase [Puniceicoccus vermicola]